MAFRMGLDNSPLNTSPFEDQAAILMSLPDGPLISQENWERIKKYYNETAPDSLIIPEQKISDTLTQFEVKPIRLPVMQHQVVTLIAQDSTKDTIYIGTRQGKLYEFNHNFGVKDSIRLSSAPSKLILQENADPTILLMGIMDPNEQPRGSLAVLQQDRTFANEIDSLQRPVDFERVDFNNDKADDYVICNFGNHTGSLTVYQGLANGKFQRHVLSNLPGARRIIIKDFDGNGLLDIMTLMSQGDERILLFYNQGNFQFRLTTLLRFTAVQGSSYIEIADFNMTENSIFSTRTVTTPTILQSLSPITEFIFFSTTEQMNSKSPGSILCTALHKHELQISTAMAIWILPRFHFFQTLRITLNKVLSILKILLRDSSHK